MRHFLRWTVAALLLFFAGAHAQADMLYVLVNLGSLNSGTYGDGVNDSGQVTGSFNTGVATHAFLSASNGGALQDLGTLGGTYSEGFGVNDSGQVTGFSNTANGDTHAFLSGSNGGALQDLGTLGGTASSVME